MKNIAFDLSDRSPFIRNIILKMLFICEGKQKQSENNIKTNRSRIKLQVTKQPLSIIFNCTLFSFEKSMKQFSKTIEENKKKT